MKRLASLLFMSLCVSAKAQTSVPPQPQSQQPAHSDAFPAPPGQAPQQQVQSSFPRTTYAPGSYAVNGQPNAQTPGQAPLNGSAPLPPLAPPPKTPRTSATSEFEQAEKVVAPFSGEDIVKLHKKLDDTRKATGSHPVRTIPRISTTSVDLSPGAVPPIARTLPGELTTLVFLDSTGKPWPIALPPRNSNPKNFDVEWLKDTPSIIISALTGYDDGNLTVFLKGLATPVAVKLVTGEPDSKTNVRIVDYRLDLHVPGRGPNADPYITGPGKIALYDDALQAFLNGIPPQNARLVPTHGKVPPRTQIWQYGDALYVRTTDDIQSAFDQSMAAGDGTRVYKLPTTPYVTLSDMGQSITLQLDVN